METNEYIFRIDGVLFNEDTGEAVMKPEYVGKLIRCKDCKHYREREVTIGSSKALWRDCTWHGMIDTEPDNYCSWGEEKDD